MATHSYVPVHPIRIWRRVSSLGWAQSSEHQAGLFILRSWFLRFSQKFFRRKHRLARHWQTCKKVFKHVDLPAMVSRSRVSANTIIVDDSFTGWCLIWTRHLCHWTKTLWVETLVRKKCLSSTVKDKVGVEMGVAELGWRFSRSSRELGCLGAKSDSLVIFKKNGMSSSPLAWPKCRYRQPHESVTVCPEGLRYSKLYPVQAQLHFINSPSFWMTCSQEK